MMDNVFYEDRLMETILKIRLLKWDVIKKFILSLIVSEMINEFPMQIQICFPVLYFSYIEKVLCLCLQFKR